MLFPGGYTAREIMHGAMRHNLAMFAAHMDGLQISANFWGLDSMAQEFGATSQYLSHHAKDHGKPAFGLSTTQIGDDIVDVREDVILQKPFMDLLHFDRDTNRRDPKVLIVAPLSGHFATLLRGTVEGLLPHHDVHITDWKNARDISLRHGKFGLEDYAQYVRECIHHIGPNTHVVAVCQPGPATLAAISIMAQNDDENQPLSLTLMGSPIDTRVARGDVNIFAEKHPIEWFRDNLISRVPVWHDGAMRPVYPGYVQLTAFMGMNPDRHAKSDHEMFAHLRAGDGQSAAKIRKFYEEYKAVLDLTAEFYLETVDKVFKRHSLPKGELVVHGQLVDPRAIKKTALLTVEGERDDISPPGQTTAAHNLTSGIPAQRHFNHFQEGAGHYGIFEGKRWDGDVRHRVAWLMREAAKDKGLIHDEIPANTRLMPPNLRVSETPLSVPSPTT